jgi:hypothetical protein
MPYVFSCEVKELVNGKIICHFILPDREEDRRLAAIAFLELMVQKINDNSKDAIALAECFFVISENLKMMFPGIGAQVRGQMVSHIRNKEKK